MQDDEFEWDDAKAQSNLRKHQVSFEDARFFVFRDVFSVETLDSRTYGEDRTIIVGMARWADSNNFSSQGDETGMR